MKTILTSLFIFSIFSGAIGQVLYSPDYVHPKDLKKNYTEDIFSDELSTSRLLVIVEDVPLHKHEKHTEHVYVLEGSGDMHIGDENISIAAHDFLVIPKNTAHMVKITSREPLKIISIMSPQYSGKDKIMLE